MELPTVALDAQSRRDLAKDLEGGIVAVRLRSEGCKLELERLPHCVGTPKYDYQPFWSAKTNSEIVHDAGELSVRLPLGGDHLGGMLGGGRVLRTDSLVVGVAAVADSAQVRLAGPDCERATHAIRKFYLGGFAMVRGASRLLEGGTSVFRAGDASQSNEVEQVAREGDPAECEQAAKQGKRRAQCAVPVKIRLEPLKWVVWGAPGASGNAAPTAASSAPSGASAAAMVRFAAGGFGVGASSAPGPHLPARKVPFESYEMDVTEVTAAAYQACVQSGRCTEPRVTGTDCNFGHPSRQQHPINCVSFDQAVAYCQWAGKRLPTEEEWERAAGGLARPYPWGEAVPASRLCWNGAGNGLDGGKRTSTCPVGAYPQGDSPFGLHDMAGNVAEFAIARDCLGYVVRGGGFVDDDARYARTAIRDFRRDPSVFVGFRCARGPAPKASPVGCVPISVAPGHMMRIPGGSCEVGSNDPLLTDAPVRTVTVESFDIDVNEVTVAEYKACVGDGMCSRAQNGGACNAGRVGRERHPINCIDFTDAKAYCRWARKRLPTEEEWEYAARGADGRIYPWGNAPPGKDLCWNGRGNDVGKGKRTSTCPVGSYAKGDGPFGLHDMAGNLAEFAVSGSGEMPNVGAIRGGGFLESVNQYVDPARRRPNSGQSESVGFRCAWSLAAEGLADATPLGMVRIPTGTFAMGSNDLADQPVHPVTVKSFELDVTEVTVADYRRCVGARRCAAGRTGWSTSGERHPVNHIDPRDAKAYCAWVGKRLPTEEEWEYAARGTDGRQYPWGDSAPGDQLCWNGEGNDAGKGRRSSTCPVGMYPQGDSPFGVHDMAGNVWEYVTGRKRDDGALPLRGGAWTYATELDVRAVSRTFASSGLSSMGFRCARSR